jgi:hypothetical protein
MQRGSTTAREHFDDSSNFELFGAFGGALRTALPYPGGLTVFSFKKYENNCSRGFDVGSGDFVSNHFGAGV